MVGWYGMAMDSHLRGQRHAEALAAWNARHDDRLEGDPRAHDTTTQPAKEKAPVEPRQAKQAADLQRTAELVTKLIGNGRPVPRNLADRYDRLRGTLGIDWDATNDRWIMYDDTTQPA